MTNLGNNRAFQGEESSVRRAQRTMAAYAAEELFELPPGDRSRAATPVLFSRVFKTAARIEGVVGASQASAGPAAEVFSTHRVMRNIGDGDDLAGWLA
jgi:hypothetical protein